MNRQPLDYPRLRASSRGRSATVTYIDSGKHAVANTVCGALCGISMIFATVASVIAWTAITERRVILNHTMDLEARQSVMEKELQELKNAKR